MIVYYISSLVFVAFFLIIFIFLYSISKRKDPVKLRLKDLKEGEEGKAEKVKRALSLVADSDKSKGTKVWLAQAGYRGPQSVSNYYGARLLLALLLGIVSVLLTMVLQPQSSGIIPLAGFAGILIGAFIPKVWVSQLIIRKREEVRRSVPNMLDLMVVCVEAGLSLHAAIQKIADESKNTHRALSHELHLVNQEILIGRSRTDAFRNLARRTGVEELRSLAVMLMQADKLGVSIANSLRVLADSLRTKRAQKAEEAAHKTAVKLVFPLVLLIFPELLVILLAPALINLFKALTEMAK
ncbi:MAG: type II secretion system F family protein [Candidatus Zixiibacteriota bacterium]